MVGYFHFLKIYCCSVTVVPPFSPLLALPCPLHSHSELLPIVGARESSILVPLLAPSL